MALLTDGLVSELGDLLAYESDLQDLATAEGISISSKLLLAQTEVSAQLEASSRRPGNVFFAAGSGWRSTGSEISLPRFDLDQVVVTPPLKLWHTFRTLALFFSDAQTRKENDKYLPRARQYSELAKWAGELLFQTGVGLTATPIPRAKQPALNIEAAALPAMALYVRIAWVRGDEEGAGSPERATQTGANQALKVTPPAAPEGVTGWHVYLGERRGEALRQSESPLALGSSWTMPAGGLSQGAEIGGGQTAELFRTAPRFLQRG